MLLLSEAAIISTTMEALLYGFSLLMFILTLWILLQNRYRRRPNYLLISAACALEALALAELINNIVRVWQGLVAVGPSLSGGSESYFQNVTQHTFVIKGVLYNLQTLILDGIVIYRTYVVWSSVYPIVLPVLGWFGLLASSIGANTTLATTRVNTDNVFAGAVDKWITAVYALTLSTNLSASVLLAFKIWKVNRDVLKFKENGQLTPVVRAVVESGAIYSATITVALILFIINSVGVYVVLDMISPIICIVFNMIIIRIAFAADAIPSISNSSRQHNQTANYSGNNQGSRHGDRRRVRAYDSGGHELASLAVEITRYIETDAEASSVAEGDRKASGRLEDDDVDISSTSKPSSGIAV
ncbi:hypothetical protein ACEPAF_8689 [Sanghuangporus sanghuang]